MAEAEATPNNDAPESAPSAPISDWTHVVGFQTLGADARASSADPEIYAQELAKELGARVARFSESVDESIVLASDGVIRWLGDPVAKLVAGEDLLKPRTLILADEALPAEGREALQARLALWIAAHIRKVLGPLEALAEPGAVPEPIKDLADRIARSLGVLERERVRNQVKTLDQNARAALRKLGVRFGATYIYIPALLKPGARTLCSQLWALRRGGENEAGAERLLAFAAAGRTSFAAEGPLSPDTYRVAGFRLCGDRVVRVDIVERLTDLIRAAIPDHMRPGGRPADDASGFIVTPQMTSLTGCSGESFASILRSLGFESHKVKKADYEAAHRKPAATTPVVAIEVASETPAAEPPAAVEEASDEIAEAPAEAVVAEVEPAPLETEPEAIAPALEAVEAVVVEESEPVAEVAAAPAEEIEAVAEAAPALAEEIEPAAEAAPAPAEDAAPADPSAPPAEDELIEVWRPAPRRRPQPAPRPREPAAEGEAGARPPRPGRDFRRFQGRDRNAPRPQLANGEAAPAATPVEAIEPRESGGGAPHRPGGRRPPLKGQRNEGRGYEGRGSENRNEGGRGAKEPSPPPRREKEQRAAPVNMDSPFAKLLDLKPLLERRDKRT